MGTLETLFEKHFRVAPTSVKAVQGDLGASGRKIIRLTNGERRAIGVLYDGREENVAFLEFSRHFRKHGLPVPEIYADDVDQGAYIEEDLGDTTLYQFLSGDREGAWAIYRKVVEILPQFQVDAGKDLNYSLCYPRDSFDRQSITWDLNYFKYHFLKLAAVPFNEQALEDDFGAFTEFLLSARRDFFLYRDFQSRNVMVRDGDPWFVDYQGGRRGALQYDIASLLYDSKADLSPELRQELLDHYLDTLTRAVDISRDEFMRHYYAYVYVRIMQAMGAYGFRGFYERKTHFLQSVPYALKSLRWLLHNVELPVKTPALMGAFRNLLGSAKLNSVAVAAGPIVVSVFSFSFHQSLPVDEAGNGGGFVFDARGLPNPGREERFKALTGKDAAVAEYLRGQDSVQQFFDNAAALVDSNVANYQSRGFKNLMVSFGCTGGQHRSVYLAELLAKHLSGRAGVEVVVRHVEMEKIGK